MPQAIPDVRCSCVRNRAGKQLACELGEGHEGPHYARTEDLGPFLWTGSNKAVAPPPRKLAVGA